MSGKKYLPKYSIGRSEEPLKGYEVQKIVNGVNKAHESNQFWRILPWALLLAFAIFTIIILCSGGGNVSTL
jgi:hypothetical protein